MSLCQHPDKPGAWVRAQPMQDGYRRAAGIFKLPQRTTNVLSFIADYRLQAETASRSRFDRSKKNSTGQRLAKTGIPPYD